MNLARDVVLGVSLWYIAFMAIRAVVVLLRRALIRGRRRSVDMKLARLKEARPHGPAVIDDSRPLFSGVSRRAKR